MANTETITLGGGCFWCIEAVYKRMNGVRRATSGYAGGSVANPTYEAVCAGRTGHAEVVQVEFDPEVVGLADVLRRFFSAHDPTTPNRQGNDVGTQYRSAVYYHDERQLEVVEAVRREVQATLSRPIVTEVAPLSTFYPAEEYHRDYFDRNPGAGYCRLVIAPKLTKLGIPTIPLG